MDKKLLPLFSVSIILVSINLTPALAHQEIVQGDIQLEVGWVAEPGLVGQANNILLIVKRVSDGQPIANALAQADISVSKGGEAKPLDFLPQEEQGVYYAPIIPTETGQISIILKGTIGGQAFDQAVEIEDVQDTRRLEFPSGTSGNPIPQEMLGQLQTVMTDLATQVEQANTASEEAKQSAQAAASSAGELKLAADRAYLFGIIGVSIGVAGVALGAIALSRREKT